LKILLALVVGSEAKFKHNRSSLVHFEPLRRFGGFIGIGYKLTAGTLPFTSFGFYLDFRCKITYLRSNEIWINLISNLSTTF